MAMKKLAPNIQSLFCATIQIKSYKSAVEELVYNSLDAEATSIAIRVNIDENSIQVIDNGLGVAKNDFKLLGHRYATSKCADISSLKSVPNKHGFRGQSLASVIEVSKRLNITSRCADTEETWTKEFYKGKESRLAEATMRPSKGTTVEIKGFLHNLHIQKRVVDSLSELNDIKIFLEQLSLVHNNISLSLRDDSKNEIVFKLHKNRDIYQTLSTMFGVEKKDLQELKVEKNEYKVTAVIAKRDRDISQYHWVYLNGKFITSSKMYKIIDGYLMKLLGLKNTKRKTKLKNNMIEPEDVTSKKTIPMYFIFITCPYYDYDISYVSKESTLEFKNWNHLEKLIEKLVKFYIGDLRMKEIPKIKATENIVHIKEDETREQVKKIMERILRSHSKKPGVSQMQNGVKGKIIKRKTKKRTYKLPVTKVISPVEINVPDDNDINTIEPITVTNKDHVKDTIKDKNGEACNKNQIIKDTKQNKDIKNLKLKKFKEQTNASHKVLSENQASKLNVNKKKNKTTYTVKKKPDNCKDKIKQKLIRAKQKLRIYKNAFETKKEKSIDDTILRKFKNQSDSVKHRCNVLAKNVEKLMSFKKKRKRKIFVNETVQYSTVVKDNKNVSVRRKVDEIVIQDFIPLPPKFNPCSFDKRVWKKLPEKSCKTTYDLIQTILKSQHEYGQYNKDSSVVSSELMGTKEFKIPDNPKCYESDNIKKIEDPKYSETLSEVYTFTYDSHQYTNINKPDYNISNSSNTNDHFECIETRNGNKHFITRQSRENFVISDMQHYKNNFENRFQNYFSSRKQPLQHKNSLFTKFNYKCKDSWHQENSFSIDFTKSNNCEDNINCDLDKRTIATYSPQNSKIRTSDKEYEIPEANSICGGTYTIISNTSQTSMVEDDHQYRHSNHVSVTQKTYCIRASIERRTIYDRENSHCLDNNNDAQHKAIVVNNYNEQKCNDMNIVFVSKSQDDEFNNLELEPLNICETVMNSNHDLQEEVDFSKRIFNDSLFNYDMDSMIFDRDAYTHVQNVESKHGHNNKESFSQYFIDNINESKEVEEVLREAEQEDGFDLPKSNEKINEKNIFNLKTRSRFVPKGLSPIFVNCQTKNACDYNLEKDYYEDAIYNQFADNVQAQSEIFEPNIQNLKELRTKDIARVNEKLDKDNASLVFNGESLEQAIVLRQIDSKFIAVKIKGRCYQSAEVSEHLVLFDQHAVHERIRLEKNLADYLVGEEWKSVALDEIPLKLTKEEVIYMHNYKEKFSQFGLQWTVLSDEQVKITGIPEAILGKNSRQVDVVMKAVRNLISEEVHALKTQKGCVSLYPKSIMDLVFSEACRYAIKFGDKLSTHECMGLLRSLAKCKTPFQCAHGRPVMAVLMNIESDNRRKYQIVKSKLHQFVKKKYLSSNWFM